jgi:hypothetical protein
VCVCIEPFHDTTYNWLYILAVYEMRHQHLQRCVLVAHTLPNDDDACACLNEYGVHNPFYFLL